MSEDNGTPSQPSGDQPAPPPPPYPAPGAPGPYGGHAPYGPQPGYPGYPPPQGGMPHPGMPQYPLYVVPDHPKATSALIVGVVSVGGMFLCGLPILAAPVAWVLGAQARKEIRNAPQQWGGESKATTGMVLGIIGSVLLVLAVIAIVLLIVLVTTAGTDSTTFDTSV